MAAKEETVEVSISDLISSEKLDQLRGRLRKFFGFVVKSSGDEAELAGIRHLLDECEEGRAGSPFLLLVKTTADVPVVDLKLLLEIGPSMENYTVAIAESFKSRQLMKDFRRMEVFLDCVTEVPSGFASACKLPDVAAIKFALDVYGRPSNTTERTPAPDTICSLHLKTFEPQTLLELAQDERWFAILNRVRNDLVKTGSSAEVTAVKNVYQLAGQVGKFGVQMELAYFYADIFAPQAESSRAELALVTGALARVFVDLREGECERIERAILATVKKTHAKIDAKLEAGFKSIQNDMASVREAQKASCLDVASLGKRVDSLDEFVAQKAIDGICDRIAALEIKALALRKDFAQVVETASTHRTSSEHGGDGDDETASQGNGTDDSTRMRLFQEMMEYERKGISERMEKEKSSLLGYLDGKIQGQISSLSERVGALERALNAMKDCEKA